MGENAAVNRVAHMKVHYSNCRRALANPVHSTNPLLDPHGIPREIVIYNDATKLEINTLSADFRTKQDTVLIIGEPAKHLVAFVLVVNVACDSHGAEAVVFKSPL